MNTKNPKELTLGEVIELPLYAAELLNLLNEIDAAKKKYRSTITSGVPKRHVTDRLEEKGLLNTPSLIALYPQILAKLTEDLSAAERKAILQICDLALHNTMVILEKQYENDSKKNLEGEAD